MNKQCTKCKITKHIDFFYKSKNKKDGVQSNCKECANKATNKWRNGIGKERYQSYSKSPESYEKHKKRNRIRSSEYRESLNDNYIRELICKKSEDLKPEDISIELVKYWKINLKLKRELKLTPKLGRRRTKPQ